MSTGLFNEFLASGDTLRVYSGDRLVFNSSGDGLLPLLGYASRFTPYEKGVTVFDRVVGNAAALLLIKIDCREVYSSLGSEPAAKTLRKYGIGYHFEETVPYIQNRDREGICLMEKLSLGKDPEGFYQACLSLG